MAIDYAACERLRKLRLKEAWEIIEDLAQYKEEEWNEQTFSEKGSPDYIDATLEQELESMEHRVESLMRSKVLLYYEGGFTSPKRPYQEEFERKILKLIDDQEDQIKQLEEDMRKTKDTFMCLADSLIATLKVKIEAKRVHPTKIERITRFPTHTPSVTPKTLKPTMLHRVSMISMIKPTVYRTPHQHLNSNIKMPILHSFEENKLEYEDEDEVEIKMMGTGMDKESLEHNLYEDDITLIICHNFSPTSNPPINPYSLDSSRMKVVDYLTTQTPPSPYVENSHPKGVHSFYNPGIDDPKRHYGFKPGLLGKSVSLGVDISNWEMFDDDWRLESKEVSPLGEELSLFDRPNEVERGRILEAHRLEPILQQQNSQRMTSSHNNGVYRYYHPYLNSSVGETQLLHVK
ncbi:hypothetical protein Tco_0078273 [Tanacetum coccineum]